MKLETAESPEFAQVTEEQLREAFRDDAHRGDFVILSQAPQAYMQAAGEGDGPYSLEYRDGDGEHHFCAGDAFRKEDVLRAFQWYLTGDARWRTEFSWQKLERKPWWSRSFFRIVPWVLASIALSLYVVYDDYQRRATQEKIAQERAIEDQAVSEIRKLGGYTRYGGPPEFRVTSVEFIATGKVINGKTVIDELKITDEGLVHLKALTHLQTLNLGSTKVTDVGLEHLKGLSSLETLNIRNTQVTDEGVKTLQDALPNCKIAR